MYACVCVCDCLCICKDAGLSPIVGLLSSCIRMNVCAHIHKYVPIVGPQPASQLHAQSCICMNVCVFV